MGQLSPELYLTVQEYSLGLSKKANLEKQQPTNLNSKQAFARSGGWSNRRLAVSHEA